MNVALPQRCTAQGLFPGQVALRLYRRVVESPSHRHPREMAEPDLTRFLTHLAVEGHVSESTRQVAVSAILVLYERVLEQPLNRLAAVVRAKPPKRLPVVLTRAEVVAVPSRMCGVPRLVATLQYSSGPRVLAALQLRLNGLGVATGEVVMHKEQGNKDRESTFPAALHDQLLVQFANAQRQRDHDLSRGDGRAPLLDALINRFPTADREWRWQWVFPATLHDVDSRTGVNHRHHLDESVIRKAVLQPAIDAGLKKRDYPRLSGFLSYTTAGDGYDIRTVHESLGPSRR